MLLLGLLCVAPIQQLRRFTAVVDADIWWHMRVGQWILDHHAFPHQGIFSATGAAHPWAAYSWGFEVILALLIKALGLLGVSVFVLVFQLALVLAIFSLARMLSRSFWWAWLLTSIAVWAMDLNRVNVARPVSFSILCFTLVVALTFRARETGNTKFLYWLPLIFAVWANFHIQFLYGLVLPGLLAAITTVEQWLAQRSQPATLEGTYRVPRLGSGVLWVIFAACLAATLLNPYTFHLYRVIFNYIGSTYAYNNIAEFRAPSFRVSSDYVHLILVAAAFFVIGRRKIDWFRLSFLTTTALVSFRSMRDVWFFCIPAVAIIASAVRNADPQAESEAPPFGSHARELIPVLAGALLVVVLSGIDNGLSNRALLQSVQGSYPLDAARFIEEHHLPGPLYNNFNWGGFLIGNLPDYPVSIDGRTDLYGDAYFQQEIETIMGRRSEDPILSRANVVLLPTSVPLAGILQHSPDFKVAYADKMAVVFVRTSPVQ